MKYRSKRPLWISGEGPYALLAWCGELTISLHATTADALASLKKIDRLGCGGSCERRHEIWQLKPSLELRS